MNESRIKDIVDELEVVENGILKIKSLLSDILTERTSNNPQPHLPKRTPKGSVQFILFF